MTGTIDKTGWKKVEFGDVCRNLNVTQRNPLQKGLDRFIGLEHIESNNLHISTWGNVIDGTTFTKRFKKGNVLFGKRRAYQRKVAVADFDGICSGDILVLDPIDKVIDPKLLPFICLSERFFDHAVKTSAGSLSPRTKFQDLSRFEFLLPPIVQQAKLAELLWAADEVIEKEMLLLEALYKVRIISMLEFLTGKKRFANFSLPWVEKRIKDIGLLNTSSVDKKVKEGEKIVRLVNYMDVYTSFEKKISNDLQLMMVSASENQLIKNQVNVGDVLFTPSSETPDDIGHSAVITETMSNTLHSYHLLRLSFHEEIDLNFKRYLFNNPIVLQYFTTRAKGVTRFTLSLNDLYDTVVKLPPLDEQKAIARLLSEMDDRIIANRQIIELTKSVEKSLIAKIFD